MKQRLLSLLAIAALATGAMAQSWTAPVEPDAIEPLEFNFTASDYEVGGIYYIQNVGTGQFVTGANSWLTQISVSNNGIPYVSVVVEEADVSYPKCVKLKLNGSFTFEGSRPDNKSPYTVTNTYLFRDSETNGFIDHNKQAVWYWLFEKAESGNYYWHSAPGMGDNKFPNAADQYASVTGPGAGVDFSTDIDAANNEWRFIALDNVDREAVNAAQAEYNEKLAIYNAALAAYNARIPLYEMLNDAAKYGADYSAASEVYNNADATVEEINAAVEELKPLVAQALLPYAKEHSTVAEPIDLTKYILVNPDFETGNINGWVVKASESSSDGRIGTNQGFQNNSTYKNEELGITIANFIEAWRPAPAYLSDGQIYQTVKGLPSGHYVLECDGVARNQTSMDNENYVDPEDYRGIYLFYSDGTITVHSEKTLRDVEVEDEEGNISRLPAHFTFEFDIDEVDSVNIGLMADNSNLNWMAADNFKLAMAGPSQVPPSYVALRAEVATVEALVSEDAEDIIAQQTLIDALKAALAEAKPLTADAADPNKAADYQAAFTKLNNARQAVLASQAAYVKLATFIETLDADMAKYEEKPGYEALNEKLEALQTKLQGGYDNLTISAEEITAEIDGYAAMVTAAIQELFDNAVATGDVPEEGLDISPLFSDLTFAYGTTQTAFANGYPAENPVWMNTTGTGNFKTNYSTAEVWDAYPFDIQREFTNLPKGKYTFKTHAFYRVTANDTNYPAYLNGEYEGTEYAYIYAGANHTHLVNNAALATETAKSNDWTSPDGTYVPNSQQGAHELFTDPAYADVAEQAYIAVSGSVLEDGGSIKVGFAGTANLQANHWCIFDGFEVYYEGVQGLDDEVQALIDQLMALNDPVVIETKDLWEKAIAAGNAALDADRDTQAAAIAQMQEALAACELSEELYIKLFDEVLPLYEQKKEDAEGTYQDETLQGIFDEIYAAQTNDELQSNAQIQGWIDALPGAWFDYVLSMAELDDATVDDPVELPVLVNADFSASNHTEGWTIETDATSGNRGTYENTYLEFWNTNGTSWTFYQELPKLKEGFYRLTTTALYRAAGTDAAVDSLKADNVKQHVTLFAGTASVPVMAWTDLENGAIPGKLEDLKAGDYPDLTAWEGSYENAEGETVYFAAPNNRAGLKTFEAVGRYQNTLDFGYTDGPIRIGLTQTKVYANDWCPFGAFKLEYLGTEAPDAINGVEAEGAKALAGALYSIDGRLVRNVSSAADLRGLSRGIYVIGGRKVTIK